MSATPITGYRYVVAVDESHYSRWAFNLASAQMNKHTDELVILTVARLLSSGYGYTEAIHSTQLEEEKRAKRVVRSFGRVAKQIGVEHCRLVLTYGTDVGEAIVNYLEQNPADFLLIGRCSMGAIKRVFLGSDSKHVIENAPCTVTVVKQAFGPEDIHDPKTSVIAAEEAERQERIAEYERRKAQEDTWLAKKHLAEQIQLDHESA